jgi:tetratricopeptide (TPR) repeat protein
MTSRIGAVAIGIGLLFATAVMAQSDPQRATLRLSTKSPQVDKLLQQAWDLGLDQVEQAKQVEVLRKVVKIEPNFAMGHELLAQSSLDPAEQVREQKKAFALRQNANPAEKLIIEWYQDAADHKLISAITEMNDVLSQYPHDKWVVYMANLWLTTQTQYERAAAVYERSGITNSPGLMNNVAYDYAYMRQFEKAFSLMDQYIAALPHDANPQDSYAEILRMAGHFNQAIEHYRDALAINPNFYSSQFGLADTYSLMGDQKRARQEYAVAFHKFPLPELHSVQWQTRAATTYIREGAFKKADQAFQAIADNAHRKHLSQVEADTYRQMAMYQADPSTVLALLNKADAAIQEGENTMPAAIEQERAQILRARVELAVRTGDQKTAQATVEQLSKMADTSNDKLIETSYHGAAGAWFSSKHQYKEAITELEEDINNPFSLELLAVAYQQTGDLMGAKQTTETLANTNDPTLEQALVVPAFRKCYENPSCSSNLKDASFMH